MLDLERISALLTELAIPGLLLFGAYFMVTISRIHTVPGSHQRMVLRTIERPLRWVAATFIMLNLVRSVLGPDVLGLITSPIAIWAWTKVWQMDANDDDDFWRKGARGVRSLLTRRTGSSRTVTA